MTLVYPLKIVINCFAGREWVGEHERGKADDILLLARNFSRAKDKSRFTDSKTS